MATTPTIHPSHTGGMALLTNRQLIIIIVIVNMPDSCTNTGADTS